MNVNDMFPSKYLRGSDLKAPVTVTIAKVISEGMYKPGNGMVNGWVLFVEKGSKGIVLGKTLATQIAKILNEPNTDAWEGKSITLYPEPMNIAGKPITGIRAQATTNGK